ncbi:MAG TPA: neocarzinostatin apoprotein domain-containing protein [Candidatus Dormibacteraeota bacterium]|nr:neocarzinostatin apoprotein domain-containing protein [Candidatus Dormibacteraeota bacterium]
MIRSARLMRVGIAASLCVALTAPLLGAGALTASAAGPAVTLSPATELVDGQFVRVTLTGFQANWAVYFRECIASPTNVATDCTGINQSVGQTTITDGSGNGEAYLSVYAGSDQALKNSGGTGSITCDATHACSLLAAINGTNLVGAVAAPLGFGPSPDSCPPPAVNGILGAGAATAYRAMYRWESTVCLPPSNLSVGYAVNNSIDGLNSFGAGLTQFAITGPTLPQTLPSTAPPFKYAPVTASALVLAYRMYDRRGPQITNLTLTPWLISQIYEGNIPNFAVNQDIAYLNPGVEFPGRTGVFARAEHSAETHVLTSWLYATLGPGSWPAGVRDIFPIPASGVTGATGSAAVGFHVVDPSTDFTGQGNIGFMDSSTAAFYGLPTVKIRRSDGSIIAATPATIQQALADATTNADGTITPNYATFDPNAYPMPLVSYMTTPTNSIAPSQGATLAAFLRYAVQTGQSNLPAGYVPLTASMVNTSLKAADSIPFKTPPSATPSPSPGSSSAASRSAGSSRLGATPTFGGSGATPLGALAGASPTPSTSVPCTTPTAGPSTTSSPAAASPSAKPAASPAPSASPKASAAPGGAGGCTATTASAGSGSSGPSGPLAILSGAGAAAILPSIAALALLGLLAGPAAQFIAVRRRPRTSAASAGAALTVAEGPK